MGYFSYVESHTVWCLCLLAQSPCCVPSGASLEGASFALAVPSLLVSPNRTPGDPKSQFAASSGSFGRLKHFKSKSSISLSFCAAEPSTIQTLDLLDD
jgi:hypothetical protein